MRVRPAEAQDHPALTAMLARAFEDDPVMRWVFPGNHARARYGGAFFRWSLWRCADHNVTWTTHELCDREGLPAYLETGKERNLAFYGRHGFRVTEQVRLPKGPPVWLMRRGPGTT